VLYIIVKVLVILLMSEEEANH